MRYTNPLLLYSTLPANLAWQTHDENDTKFTRLRKEYADYV